MSAPVNPDAPAITPEQIAFQRQARAALSPVIDPAVEAAKQVLKQQASQATHASTQRVEVSLRNYGCTPIASPCAQVSDKMADHLVDQQLATLENVAREKLGQGIDKAALAVHPYVNQKV